jgi:calcineurin-like phosphoesterase family protein
MRPQASLRPVRTLVISDLHLGASTGTDLLRRPDLRDPLLEAVRDVDRLVILGDGVELREGPQREVARAAAPFFADVGRALGPDKELLLLAGNHDHGLVAGWIDARLLSEPSGFLDLECRLTPDEAGPLAAALAAQAAPTRVGVAYPGVWLRDDVYAIHGHYSDLHTTVPTFERLAAGAMARWVISLPEHGATADDYEAALSPLYAWMHTLAQRSDHALVSAGAGASARAWVALAGSGRRRRPLRAVTLGAGYAAAVGAINAVGLGPVDRNLSGAALRRGGLRGMAEALRRLGVDAAHVIWGHSHRSGPWPHDDRSEWTTHAGGRLHNAGCWVYQRHFLSDEPNRSPYWPGTAILIEDAGPPRLLRLLGDRGHEELRPRG